MRKYFLYVDIRELVEFSILDWRMSIEDQFFNNLDVGRQRLRGSERRNRNSKIAIRKFPVPLVIIAQWHHPFPFRTRK